MQGFATLISVAEPFALTDPGTDATGVQLFADATVVWSDATTDALTPGATAILSAYDGAAQVDASTLVWLLVLIKGASPLLIMESDFSTIETVLSGAVWALSRRIDGPTIQPYPPV